MNTLRYLTLCAAMIFGGLTVFGQADNLAQREESLKALSGTIYIKECLAISAAYYSSRNPAKAAELARLAYSEASRGKDAESMALALNYEAKAILGNLEVRQSEKLKAVKKLEESNRLTAQGDLRLENLKMMRQVYSITGRTREMKETELEIARLVTAENQALESELAVASQEREKMAVLQVSLSQTLDRHEKAIKSMSESQAKAELLLAQQQRLLDSMVFRGMIDSLALAQQSLQLSEKEALLREREAQLNLQKAQRNFMLSFFTLILALAGGITYMYFSARRHNREIAAEKQRSDDLLLNILPEKVADELKNNGRAQAQFFESASVLFVDFEGFSQFASGLHPDELVETLDYCFQQFDRIISEYGLEKIKTIGDAYMAAGGLPSPDPSSPHRMVDAALAIKDFLDQWKLEREAAGMPYLRARIGIHTGPLVAGVVGKKKFAYDIWGDTVNVAARMESSGVAGKVNVSASTYYWIKGDFECLPRGRVPVKNLGEMDMYFVEKKLQGQLIIP